MTDPLHKDHRRIALAILAALVVWMLWNGVAKGLAAVETGEVVLRSFDHG